MYDVDIANLRAEIEAEREWRDREMRLLRNQVAALLNEEDRRLTRKTLVVMLYAHFEGVIKSILTIYLNRINAIAVPVAEAIAALSAASLSDVFHALREPNSKCKVFARELPDDSALHRFARDREFIAAIWGISARTVSINVDRVVDTEANLKPAVLRKLLFRIGLDPDLATPWEASLNLLLKRRNDISHGSARDGLAEKDYESLEAAVSSTVDSVVLAITAAVSRKAYLAKS